MKDLHDQLTAKEKSKEHWNAHCATCWAASSTPKRDCADFKNAVPRFWARSELGSKRAAFASTLALEKRSRARAGRGAAASACANSTNSLRVQPISARRPSRLRTRPSQAPSPPKRRRPRCGRPHALRRASSTAKNSSRKCAPWHDVRFHFQFIFSPAGRIGVPLSDFSMRMGGLDPL